MQRLLKLLVCTLKEGVRGVRKLLLSARTRTWYDSLSEDDVKQEEQWGSFSESQM